MHPLALENVLQKQAHGRSRADYYPKHLYLHIFSHTLSSDDGTASPNASVTHLPRSESPDPMDEKWDGMPRSGTWNSSAGRSTTLNGSAATRGRRGWSVLRRRIDEVADDYEMKISETPRSPSFGDQERVCFSWSGIYCALNTAFYSESSQVTNIARSESCP